MSILFEKYDPTLIENEEIMTKKLAFSPWFWVPAGIMLAASPMGLVHVGWLIAIGAIAALWILAMFLMYVTSSDSDKEEMRRDLRPVNRKRMYFIDNYNVRLSRPGALNIDIYREKLTEYLDAIRDGASQDSRVEKFLSNLCFEASITNDVLNPPIRPDVSHIIDEAQIEFLRQNRKDIEAML